MYSLACFVVWAVILTVVSPYILRPSPARASPEVPLTDPSTQDPDAKDPDAKDPGTKDPAVRDASVPRSTPAVTHDRPLLPDRTTDETDVGWGDRPDPDDRDRLLQDRPPHWDDY